MKINHFQMLLENNTDLLKNPAVGISVPMRAARERSPLHKHYMFAPFADQIFAKVSLSLFLCNVSSEQTQASLGSAFIEMKCYPCQKILVSKISPLTPKKFLFGVFHALSHHLKYLQCSETSAIYFQVFSCLFFY